MNMLPSLSSRPAVLHNIITVDPKPLNCGRLLYISGSCLIGSGISPAPHPLQSNSDDGFTLPQYSHLMRSMYIHPSQNVNCLPIFKPQVYQATANQGAFLPVKSMRLGRKMISAS